eukprot:s25_g17.t3
MAATKSDPSRMLATIHQHLKHSEALSVLAGHFGQVDLHLQEDLANCGVLSVRLACEAEIWLDVDLRNYGPKSDSSLKVLVVQEPPEVKSLSLEGFDLVLTWQEQHLSCERLGRRAELFVPATPWLVPAECKCRTKGHQLRHKIWEVQERLKQEMQVPLDFMEGGGISRDQRNLQFFNSFVLVIENSKQANYFSEKLLDALLARCIPVYWGCPNIGDFFDVAGMVVIEGEDIDEAVDQVLSKSKSLTPDMVELCQEASEKNYLEATRYAGDFGLRLQQAIDAAIRARPEIVALPPHGRCIGCREVENSRSGRRHECQPEGGLCLEGLESNFCERQRVSFIPPSDVELADLLEVAMVEWLPGGSWVMGQISVELTCHDPS